MKGGYLITVDDIPVGAIYPPYQLDDFQKCPYLWDIKKRWQAKPEKQSKNLLIGSILGTAVAEGLAAFYDPDGRDPVSLAEGIAAAFWTEETGLERDGLCALARRGIKRGMQTDLGLKEILGVERAFGRIRPDLVGRSSGGSLVVVDHKVKRSLD